MTRKFLGLRAGVVTKAPEASPNLTWDSHKAVDTIPDALVNSIEGNGSMRRKFEQLCRSAQV